MKIYIEKIGHQILILNKRDTNLLSILILKCYLAGLAECSLVGSSSRREGRSPVGLSGKDILYHDEDDDDYDDDDDDDDDYDDDVNDDGDDDDAQLERKEGHWWG